MTTPKTGNFYDLWKFTEDEQRQLLGEDIGVETPTIVVELDEWSLRRFYNNRFAPITIREYQLHDKTPVFQVIVHSIDDASLNMFWRREKMQVLPYQARQMIDEWLKRTNYFINLKGFEAFCQLFGECTVDYN